MQAYDIYGIPVAYVRGKLTQKAIAHAVIDPTAMMKEKVQMLHTDVMHLDGHKFLLLVVEPLQLTLYRMRQLINWAWAYKVILVCHELGAFNVRLCT